MITLELLHNQLPYVWNEILYKLLLDPVLLGQGVKMIPCRPLTDPEFFLYIPDVAWPLLSYNVILDCLAE